MEAFTNKNVFDTFKQHGIKGAVELVNKHYFSRPTSSSNVMPTPKAFEKAVKRVVDKTNKLLKNKHRAKPAMELDSFMDYNFSFPYGDEQKRGVRLSTDENLDLKQSVVIEKQKNQDLAEKLCHAETERVATESKLIASTKSSQKLRLNLKRTAARETYALKKIQKLEENADQTCCKNYKNQVKELQTQLVEKNKEIANLEVNVQYLTDLLEDIDVENRTITIFDEESKKYKSNFKSCVYDLLKLNVSASKIGDVVKTVLKLVNIEPNRVPVTSTVLEMNLQRLCLAQKQLSEVFFQGRKHMSVNR